MRPRDYARRRRPLTKVKIKLLPRAEREARLKRANEFIEVVASVGRKFFRYENRVAYFFTDPRGRLWFRDAYSYKAIYVCYKYEWRGFSNGGTLRSLIVCLRDYIRLGTPLYVDYFEPTPERLRHWAYDVGSMTAIWEAAKRLDEKEAKD